MVAVSPDVSAEFQRRRAQVWRTSRWWIGIGLVSAVLFMFVPKGSDTELTVGQFTLGLVCFILLGAAIVALVIAIRRNYRCPRCDTVPMRTVGSAGERISLESMVMLNPSRCAACGAILRN